MLDLVIGEKGSFVIDEVIGELRELNLTGSLYIGYPLLASADSQRFIDALLVCLEYGVVVFDLQRFASDDDPVEEVRDRQDDLFAEIRGKLYAHKPLRRGRDLGVSLVVLTVVPSEQPFVASDLTIAVPGHISSVLKDTCEAISEDNLREVNAVLQKVATLKPKRRTSVTRDDSRGAVMKRIEAEIANLDRWQKKAAIEMPEGPQRIRGLAGSGKTVVLALKAADLHARHPDWRIAVTFHTRSLYQQFRALISRFTIEYGNDEPDWDKLQVLHSWGGSRQPGLYSTMASANDIAPMDFLEAKSAFGGNSAFNGACKRLLSSLVGSAPVQIYDAILIDEAQDFPKSFFELCYLSLKEPHRIVWAYDELQNLGQYTMSGPEILFGEDADGRPRVSGLQNRPLEPHQDVILPVCYRNTPWALTAAHAVGFGIYREKGLVQFFDSPQLWDDIGYRVVSGQIAPNQNVVIEREPQFTPTYFGQLLSPEDAITCVRFEGKEEQAAWIANQVYHNLTEDELSHRDILIIVSDPVKVPEESSVIIKALGEHGIPSHIVGVTSSRDEIFSDGSVAISGIYRAKGNEAPMVYVANSEYGVEGLELIKRRNILFTAMSRSRAWLRVCGSGELMDQLKGEVDKVGALNYTLQFRVPTAGELDRMRKIHRDMTDDERVKAQKAAQNLNIALTELEEGNLSLEQLPRHLVDRLRAIVEVEDESDT